MLKNKAATEDAAKAAETMAKAAALEALAMGQWEKANAIAQALASGVSLVATSGKSATDAIASLRKEIETLARTAPETYMERFNRELKDFEDKAKKAGLAGNALIEMRKKFIAAWEARTEKDATKALQDYQKEMARLAGNMEEVRRIDIEQAIDGWRERLKPFAKDVFELEVLIAKLKNEMEEKATLNLDIQNVQAAVNMIKAIPPSMVDASRLTAAQNDLFSKQAQQLKEQLKPEFHDLVDKWREWQELMASPEWTAGIKRSAEAFIAEWTDAGKVAEKQWNVMMDAVQQGFSQVIDAIFDGAEIRVDKLFQQIAKELMKLAMNQMFASLLGAGKSFLSGLFAHTGGIIGQDALPMRRVSPFAFAAAPKFHAGGVVGLASNEVPAVLQRGEGVFTRAQMAALGRGLQGSAQPIKNIVNVHTPPGAQARTEQRQDGWGNVTTDVFIEMIRGAVASDINTRRGPVTKALQGFSA
jgi:hypothetical protein